MQIPPPVTCGGGPAAHVGTMPAADAFAPSLWVVVAVFAAAAGVIALAGVRLARVADGLAEATGLGETLMGAVFVGASTSLPGVVTSVAAAWAGHPVLAISNAIGGIAAQTAFLGIADIAYRRVNLEHAAASVTNLMQGALLMALLAAPLVIAGLPPVTFGGVNPASGALVLFYLFGLRLMWSARAQPMWAPRRTRETQVEAEGPPAARRRSLLRPWAAFAALALVTALSGYAVAWAGIGLVGRTPLSETAVGGILTAVATSLPELVTAVAAVRRGALNLAVGDILGGNAFDVLFLAFADAAWRGGSLYHQIAGRNLFILALALLMTAILLMGLLSRQKRSFGGIGFESVLVLVLYAIGAAVLVAG